MRTFIMSVLLLAGVVSLASAIPISNKPRGPVRPPKLFCEEMHFRGGLLPK